VTYHDSCSGLRELSVKEQPRRLLRSVAGLELVELPGAETCCGFGGTFCVKYPEISNRMVEDKAQAIEDTGAGTLLAGDLGCLLNMAGKLKRRGAAVRVRHVAEVLAGMTDGPAIGDGADGG
jgi:L-lactate dehydrogenase complex protein LldE